jgi:hypothetical protein
LRTQEAIPSLKGHWKFDVYDGDVERAPLTAEQIRENQIFREIMAHNFVSPLHVGSIVSKPIDSFEGDNLVTTAGKGLLLDRLFETAGFPVKVSAMGVGNSATTAVIGDTLLLGATPSPTLLAFDSTPTRAALVVTCVRTFATGEGNMNWQELGLFNGTTNGTSILLNRIAPIGPFNKTSAVSIVTTVTITQS